MVLGPGFFFSSYIANEVKGLEDNSTGVQLNTQHIIPLKLAQQITTATQTACTEKGFPVTVSILNKDGVDILLARGDGTTGASVGVARDKAYAAVGFQSPTSALEERAKTSSPGIIAVDGFTVLPGGLPIRVADELVGGIGVSGAPSGKVDEECAKSGLATIDSGLSNVNSGNSYNPINKQLANNTSKTFNNNITTNN
jgi:uncharacterized protein GlcG (DUF336 family)